MLRLRIGTLGVGALISAIITVADRSEARGASRVGHAASEASLADHIFVVEGTERWLNGAQRAEYVRPSSNSRWVSVDEDRRRRDGSRVLHMRFRAPTSAAGVATLLVNGHGKALTLRAHYPQPPSEAHPIYTAAEDFRRSFDGSEDGETIVLPASRVWDLIPTLPATLRVGVEWSDKIDLADSVGDFSQSLIGVRTSRVERDTSVGGRRLFLIRDSARVRYAERGIREERTLDTLVTISRAATGVILGHHLLDPELGAYRYRVDSTRLSGRAVLRYPDGRRFSTPARYERVRHIHLYTRADYERVVARDEAQGDEFSIIMRPEGLAERVSRGDAHVTDSLMNVFGSSRDPVQRDDILMLFKRWSRRNSERRAIVESAFASGDSALGLAESNQSWRHAEQIDTTTMRRLLAVMRDPAVPLSLGLQIDEFYELANDALLSNPPAAETDTLRWPCAPEACRMLASEWPHATEPRLRSLALVARFVLDPASQAAPIMKMSARIPLITGVQTLAMASSPRVAGGPSGILPERDADWRSWSWWWKTVESWHFTPRIPQGDSRLRGDSLTEIPLAHLITGRDFVAEWKAAYAHGASDSAKIALGQLLLSQDVAIDDTVEIARQLLSRNSSRRLFANRELSQLLSVHGHAADSATAVETTRALLETSLDGAPSWPTLRHESARDSSQMIPHRVVDRLDGAYGPDEKVVRGSIILFREGIPRVVLAEMQRRGVLVVDSTYRLPSSESGILLSMHEPTVFGPFLELELTHQHLGARVKGRGQSWAQGSTYILMRTPSGWRIIEGGGWIT